MANMTPQELPEKWRTLADMAVVPAYASACRDNADELEAALAGAGAVAEVVETRCGCHPETCCCGEYTLKINGSYAACGTKARMDRIADAVNVTHPAPVAGAVDQIADMACWIREDDGRTYLSIRVTDGADLSCKAKRRAALTAALEAKK